MTQGKVKDRSLISLRNFIIVDIVLCLGIIGFLFWLIYVHQTESSQIDLSYLPTFNAICNSLCTFFLCIGLIFIKLKRVNLHFHSMNGALVCSTVFLIGYLIYHYFHGDTHFLHQGWIRNVYFFILISHIVLSVITLPAILLTYWLALFKKFNLHRRFARVTWPIWMYVSITGVIVYLLLYHY